MSSVLGMFFGCCCTHLDFDLAFIGILAFSRTQNLKRQDLVRFAVVGNNFAVEDESGSGVFLEHLGHHRDDVRVLGGVVLRVSAEDLDRAVFEPGACVRVCYFAENAVIRRLSAYLR